MIETETFTGIRPFRAEDMIWIIEDGVKEYGLKVLGNDNIKELAENREANGQCITGIVNDRIIGCGGIDLMWEGVGEVWALLSYETDKHTVMAYRIIRDGLKKLIESGKIDEDEVVVCVTTGHGLKDPDIAIKISEKPFEVDVELESVEKLLGLLEPIRPTLVSR